jgi:hypothetical protein
LETSGFPQEYPEEEILQEKSAGLQQKSTLSHLSVLAREKSGTNTGGATRLSSGSKT